MTAFYVGQRVRLVRPFYQENYGIEGTLVSRELNPKGTKTTVGPLPFDCDCLVHYESYSDEDYPQSTSQLEPITQLDNTTTTWEEMPCDRDGKFKGIPA